jgi:hypothetical protein
MTFNIQNLPSITDLSYSILVTAIYKGNAMSSYYGNNISLNTGIDYNTATTFTPMFASAPATNSENLVTQSIVYLYFSDASYVLSSVNSYSN